MAMDIPKNHFKAGLIEGRQQIGLWASLASPISTEIIAGSGFDWLLLDMEHSANDLRDIYSQIQVMAEGAASAVVRVPSDDPITIKRILDTGVQSLMIPNIDDADQARRAVAATRYAPRGVRGFSQSPRAARFGRVADYHAGCEAEICVIVQLESMRALDNLEAIAAVEGVDGLFIGPGDLSMSLGYLGQQNHPDVARKIEEIIGRIRQTRKPAGILTANEGLAHRYIAAGSSYTAVGSDIGLLARASEALASRFRPGA
jgi:4-hydroxy-2-oxoheptanedioate aldolase